MYVTFESRDPCTHCGCHLRAFMFCSMRINKRSMRSVGTNLIAMDNPCPECRADSGRRSRSLPPRWRLSAEDAGKVHAYRLRRWPELAGEVHGD